MFNLDLQGPKPCKGVCSWRGTLWTNLSSEFDNAATLIGAGCRLGPNSTNGGPMGPPILAGGGRNQALGHDEAGAGLRAACGWFACI